MPKKRSFLDLIEKQRTENKTEKFSGNFLQYKFSKNIFLFLLNLIKKTKNL